MDSYYFVIGVTLVGFFTLAAALLVPVYLFLKKEEKLAEFWTDERIATDTEPEEAVAGPPFVSEQNALRSESASGSRTSVV